MNMIKKHFLNAAFAIAFLFFIQDNASARMRITWSDGSQTDMDGDCSTVCYGSNGYPKCTNLAKAYYNPKKDYIMKNANGEAWVVKDGVSIPIASDGLTALMKQLLAKYGKSNKDPKTIKLIDAEYASFRKTDNHKISQERLNLISKETGLTVREK